MKFLRFRIQRDQIKHTHPNNIQVWIYNASSPLEHFWEPSSVNTDHSCIQRWNLKLWHVMIQNKRQCRLIKISILKPGCLVCYARNRLTAQKFTSPYPWWYRAKLMNVRMDNLHIQKCNWSFIKHLDDTFFREGLVHLIKVIPKYSLHILYMETV